MDTRRPVATAETFYRCATSGCNQLLFIAPATLVRGVLRGVYCRGCHKRVVVYLGGEQRGEPLVPPPDAPPPPPPPPGRPGPPGPLGVPATQPGVGRVKQQG